MYSYGHGDGYFFERRTKRVPGRRVWEPLGEDLNRAISRATELNDKIARGDYSQGEREALNTTISYFLDRALDGWKASRSKTFSSYANRVRHLNRYLSEEHPKVRYLGEFTPQIAQGYLDWRRDQDVTRCGWKRETTPTSKPSAYTLETDVFRLRALFEKAVTDGLLKANPFDGVRIPPSRGKQKPVAKKTAHPFTEDELRRLAKAARAYDASASKGGSQSTFKGMTYHMVRMYVLTGLRNRELVYLPWAHVHLDWNGTGKIDIDPYEIPVRLRVKPTTEGSVAIRRLAQSRSADEPLFESRDQMRECLPSQYSEERKAVTDTDFESNEERLDAMMKARARDWNDEDGVLRVAIKVRWTPKATQGSVPLVKEARDILRERHERRGESPWVPESVAAHPSVALASRVVKSRPDSIVVAGRWYQYLRHSVGATPTETGNRHLSPRAAHNSGRSRTPETPAKLRIRRRNLGRFRARLPRP
jgi:hypothetical protein